MPRSPESYTDPTTRTAEFTSELASQLVSSNSLHSGASPSVSDSQHTNPASPLTCACPPSSDEHHPTEPSQNGQQRVTVESAHYQPFTASGKPRERVSLACAQCRHRKIRCDGTKPECNNCTRRTRPCPTPCFYDEAPRRRGKDRTPGSRKLAPFIPKKTRTTRSRLEEETKRKKAMKLAETPANTAPCCNEFASPDAGPSTSTHVCCGSTAAPVDSFDLMNALLLQPSDLVPANLCLSQLVGELEADEAQLPQITPVPSLQFIRETWWDSLLALYAASLDKTGLIQRGITADIRNGATDRIKGDFRLLFRVSLLWYSFFNVPQFISSLFDQTSRQEVQPGLVLAALALSTLLQSSELEFGSKGMDMALRLVDQAYAAFYASLNCGWVDVGLAKAAYLLTAFELQAHPKARRPHRTREAMGLLDSLIRYLALTTLDIDDSHTTIFLPHAVPTVRREVPLLHTETPEPHPLQVAMAVLPFADEDDDAPSPNSSAVLSTSLASTSSSAQNDPTVRDRCGCQAYSLGEHYPRVRQLAPQFAQMPMWPAHASAAELRKEECRRLVWASVVLVTALGVTKVMAMTGEGWELPQLWIQDAANYALLFPGESLAEHTGPSTSLATSKDSVWALYMRALFLWNGCLRMQRDAHTTMTMGATECTMYSMRAYAEMDAIEAALARHTCITETGFFVKICEVFFNTRICISQVLHGIAPDMPLAIPHWLDYRDKAEQWSASAPHHTIHHPHTHQNGMTVHHQLHVANYFTQCLRTPRTKVVNHARRNFLVAWFLTQIVQGLALWEKDHTLHVALDVACAFAPCAEYYLRLWPAQCQMRAFERLYARLLPACDAAGVEPPARIVPLGNLARGLI
ncbi:hypothetical protein C8Q77DRAFT_1130258 [Trametes polyzona]|nr:hypothetical protein C8Q77DRAFT_1130258 [Trametes polyzona]